MRRHIVEQPVSLAARACFRAASSSWCIGLGAVAIIRSNALDLSVGYMVLATSIILAGAALMLAAAAARDIWRTGDRGLYPMFMGAFGALAWLVIPGYFAIAAIYLPAINDVSTDWVDPPAFSSSAKAMAAREGATPPEASIVVRHIQQDRYPQIRPIILEMELEEAYALVLRAARALRWRIVDQTIALPSGQSAQIDAVQKSFFLALPDDIVVRLNSAKGQTKIDFRSVSRSGRHDFGQNAKRAEAFTQAVQDQLDAR